MPLLDARADRKVVAATALDAVSADVLYSLDVEKWRRFEVQARRRRDFAGSATKKSGLASPGALLDVWT